MSIWGLDPFIAIPIVAVVMFLFGALIQTTLITRSIKEDGDQNVLFLTCCLGIFLSNVALMLFTSDYKTADSMFANQVVTVAGMNISVPRLVGFFILCVATALVFLMLKYTKLGKHIRATSQNAIGAQVTGIKTKVVYAYTYGIGAAIAGIAGAWSDVLLLCVPVSRKYIRYTFIYRSNNGRSGEAPSVHVWEALDWESWRRWVPHWLERLLRIHWYSLYLF